MLDRVTPAFEHLLRNSVAHGIESPELRKRQGKPAEIAKVDKPAITPIQINRDAESDFLKRIKARKVNEIAPVFVDYSKDIVTIPTKELSDKGFPMGICYSSEMIHNQFTPGRKNYCMIHGEYLPRLGYTEVGERLTLNGVAWDNTAYSVGTSKELYDAVKARLATGTDVYAYVVEGSKGKLVIGAKVTDALCEVYAQVVKCHTNADGSLAFMFQMVRKPTV